MKKYRKINYMQNIAITVTLGFLALSIFVYGKVFTQLKQSVVDLFRAIKLFFISLFVADMEELSLSAIENLKVNFKDVIPVDTVELKDKLLKLKDALIDRENISAYSEELVYGMVYLFFYLMVFSLFIMCIKLYKKLVIQRVNNDYGVDSKTLKKYKRIEGKISCVIDYVKAFFDYANSTVFKTLWLVIWLYNLNIFNMILDFFGCIFYFEALIDFYYLYFLVYKMLIDLTVTFLSLPWYIWCVVFWILILRIRKKIAIRKLIHNENKNTGFAKSLGIATMFTAPMNGGKTKMVTDLSLTFVSVFKADSYSTMQKIDLQFPDFPFIRLERHIQELRAKHVIYSLASIEQYFKWKKRYFEYCQRVYKEIWCVMPNTILYGYDYEKYGLYYDNKLYYVNIFEAIITYAKAYFIYSMPDSFIVSNFAIREDGRLDDLGNLPLWDFNYFNRNSGDVYTNSRYSKILDFDVLRKGKKVVENNPLSDTFEFGIVSITEFDKDRGNTLDTKELKKMVDEANQKNDLFNYSPKLARHGSTIDFNPYTRYLFDLQRAMKTEADLREICDCIIEVGDMDKGKLAMPFFFIEEFIYGLMYNRYKRFYEEYRFYHGDNILITYIIKKVCGKFINYYNEKYNLYGYDVQKLKVFTGKMDNKPDKHKYYEAYGKIHALRYSTDCYSDFLKEGVLRKGKGIIDYPSYNSYLATRKELNMQNSYFIKDLENVSKNSPS